MLDSRGDGTELELHNVSGIAVNTLLVGYT